MGRSIKLSPETLAETRRLHVDLGMTVTEVAKHFGITTQSVRQRLDRAGVPRPKAFDKTAYGYDLLHRLYVVDKLTAAQIGAKLGINFRRAFDLLEHHGIARRRAGEYRRIELDRDLMHKLYVVDNLSISRIMEMIGVSRMVIKTHVRKHGLVRPGRGHTRLQVDRDTLYQLYVTESLTFAAVAAKFGVCGATIAKQIRRHKIPTRKRSGRLRLEIDRDVLYDLSYLQGRSPAKIAAALGTSPMTIRQRLVEYGIPRRDQPKSAALDHEKLRELYVDRALPVAQIMKLIKADRRAIIRELKNAGIPLRPPRRSPATGDGPPRSAHHRAMSGKKLDPGTLAETRRMRVDLGMSVGEVAEHFGISKQAVWQRLARADAPRRKVLDKTKFSYELVHQLYVVDELTLEQLGAKFGISLYQARTLLTYHNIPARKVGKATIELDGDMLRQLYVTERLRTIDISAKLGICVSTVLKELKRHGIPVDPQGNRDRFEIDRDLLYNQYYLHSRTADEIAAKLGTTANIVKRRLDEYGIPRRRRRKLTSRDHEKLRELYVDRALPLARIIRLLKADRYAIIRELKNAGIPLRPPGHRP